MDLMKAFTEKYTKEEPPVVQVGDTVRVHLKVKEATASVSRCSRVPLSPRSTAALRRPSPSAASPTASVWRRCSPSTLPPSRRWKWCGTARCAALSCTTCADAWQGGQDQGGPLIQSKKGAVSDRSFSYQDSLAVQAAEGGERMFETVTKNGRVLA